MGTQANNSVLKTARSNLLGGLSTPVGKVALVFIAVAILAVGALALSKFRNAGSVQGGGAATATGFAVSGARPRGAADPEVAVAVAAQADADSKVAAARGQSYGGPFVFERGADSGTSGSSVTPGVDNSAQVFAALKKRAADYDLQEESTRPTLSGGQGSTDYGQVNAGGYGVTTDDAKKISTQIDASRTPVVRFELLPGGILSRQSNVPGFVLADQPAAFTANATTRPNLGSPFPTGERAVEVVIARAGSICAGAPESAINTDINLPVFVVLLDCGDLTGAKVRGSIVKSIDNFTVRFTNVFPDPAKRLKIAGNLDAVAVSIDRDGSPEIADDVDRHWVTRLASSALLALAKTEQQFLGQRGSSTTSTGLSSTTSVEPVSSGQQQSARVAGVVSGAFDVITRDVSTGVNRQATMSTKKSTLVGIQFLDDVKAVRFE